MPITIKGDGLVAVWHSHPKWGDPMEGVFYMERPYTPAMRDLAFENRGVMWLKSQSARGFRPTTRPQFVGPFDFEHKGRHDLSENRRGHDEFVIIAWFKREKPEVLPVDEIDMRRQLAQRYGLTPPEPVRYMDTPTPGVSLPWVDEFGPYRDPNGLNEAGVPDAHE